jgi:RNA polymerase sigma-70 factor (ECF subfamily)
VGTEISFKEIYEEFHPKILRYLSRLAGRDAAEDIAQEVFEKVSRNLGSFRGESKISTWIYRQSTVYRSKPLWTKGKGLKTATSGQINQTGPPMGRSSEKR